MATQADWHNVVKRRHQRGVAVRRLIAMLARTPRDLGLLIRDRRRALGLGQKELAERAGVGRQWVVEVEAGKARAEVGLVLRTLTALGLELDVRPRELPQEATGTPAEVAIDLSAILKRAGKPTE